MTPQQCLEARARLGWSRQDLAAAAAIAQPIVRMFEAGALSGFPDCEAAIEQALTAAEAARARPAASARTFEEAHARRRPAEGALVWLVETRRRWRRGEFGPGTGGFAEAGIAFVSSSAPGV